MDLGVIYVFQEIKLDMGHGNGLTPSDPLSRLDPLINCLHQFSPLQCLIYVRLTSEHWLQRHKRKLWIAFVAFLIIGYVIYLAFAFKYVSNLSDI